MENMNKADQGTMALVCGDVVLGLHGDGFDYLFSYSAGGPVSLAVQGREWLYRAPSPAFWRATTDNDRGNGFSYGSAMWLGADLFIRTESVEVFADGQPVKEIQAPGNNRFSGRERAGEARICYRYRTATVPAAGVELSYTVRADGRIRVDAVYEGAKGLPELPAFGVRFIMPTPAEGYAWKGLSGETYPDRMAGGVFGQWEETGLPVTPYLVPQECGMHMETEELVVTRSRVLSNADRERRPFSLRFRKEEKPFAFSCLPYTAGELEMAWHQEELPPVRRTVVCILGAVRGVGGIDSWGADVETPYHIDGEKEIRFSFWMEPVME